MYKFEITPPEGDAYIIESEWYDILYDDTIELDERCGIKRIFD